MTHTLYWTLDDRLGCVRHTHSDDEDAHAPHPTLLAAATLAAT
ncbi:hypothetical protein [Micrococcus luteus]|nr:hypothetical protein [Micrococcus luteus]